MSAEFAYIDLLRSLATHPGARGLADDAAVIELGSETLILTHDSIAEGMHVRCGTDPADIAWKLIATNLSDLAAKGAAPLGVLTAHALGEPDWDAAFVEGLRAVLETYDVPLLGGDTIRLPDGAARVFGCTAIGRATCSPVPARSGAKPGDALWVTGAIGDAFAGFTLIEAGGAVPDSLAAAYLRPVPLLFEGRALAPLVHAMMDVSDGLLLDAARMAEASGMTVRIDSARVPISAAARAAIPDRLDEALRWGDDYALLFAAPTDFEAPTAAARIGDFIAVTGAALLLDGRPLEPGDAGGYRH
ncbi:thiamine-phosphate kinase [Novosphingopyxis sp.]|uniref:thiamine-phosphate kinase n=1 Tax=Novosphingopyxis sp. TaxID=2709690 RepID=UPI003B5C49E7